MACVPSGCSILLAFFCPPVLFSGTKSSCVKYTNKNVSQRNCFDYFEDGQCKWFYCDPQQNIKQIPSSIQINPNTLTSIFWCWSSWRGQPCTEARLASSFRMALSTRSMRSFSVVTFTFSIWKGVGTSPTLRYIGSPSKAIPSQSPSLNPGGW